MNQLKTQIRTLITEHRYLTDPAALCSLAKQLFHQRPVLYGTLIYVSQFLSDELEQYSGQGLPMPRYNEFVQLLTSPLVQVLDAESGTAKDLLKKLDAVHTCLFQL